MNTATAGKEASSEVPSWQNRILYGDNLLWLKKIPSESISLIYIDPPFNTGRRQQRNRIKATAVGAATGDRAGFGGKSYKTTVVSESAISYDDSFSDFLVFLRPRLEEAYRLLKPNGSLFFHIDWRQAASCRLLLESIFGGPEYCLNEIIWAYDYGARSRCKWPTKHDNIYWFARRPDDYIFNYDGLDRIPYQAPQLVGEKKAARGKTPTDVWSASNQLVNVWWQTIVPTNSKEKRNYPTQKPQIIAERIIKTHSHRGDTVMDCFAGSGTVGMAAKTLGRHYILIDNNKDAIGVMKTALSQPSTTGPSVLVNASTEPEQIFDQAVLALSRQADISKSKRAWQDSRYEWMLALPPATKGKLGRDLVKNLISQCVAKDVRLHQSRLQVGQQKIVVKMSMLWQAGCYRFEQIKKSQGDLLCLLGISPNQVHIWMVSMDYFDQFSEQHGESSRWIEIKPDDEKSWPPYMRRTGGTLNTTSIYLIKTMLRKGKNNDKCTTMGKGRHQHFETTNSTVNVPTG